MIGCIHIRVYTFFMETKVFKSGNSLAVRLPKGMELPCGKVSISRQGDRLVIEALSDSGWPEGWFESVRIDREDFGREEASYCEKPL